MNPWLKASIAALLGATPWLSSRAAELMVYRCTGAEGAVSLQDTPCPPGHGEQARSMTRPIDAPPPPPRPVPVEPVPVPAEAPLQQERVARVEPQPLYDCQRHDGSVYESDTGVPERHWVPLWVVGMDPRAPPQTFGTVGRPKPRLPAFRPGLSTATSDPALALGAGTWVEDRCYRVSAAVACERRQQRLRELRHRIFNAQQRERDRLRIEHGGLREQLQRECGIG